jgi:hypothetical protein
LEPTLELVLSSFAGREHVCDESHNQSCVSSPREEI